MEFVLTEYLRMSGVYWGITCLELLGQLDAMDSAPIIEWLLRCQARLPRPLIRLLTARRSSLRSVPGEAA